MAVNLQAFRGWRYDPGKVDYGDVTAPPYDVITPQMQEALYQRHEKNVVRLTFGREFPTDTPQDNRYTRAAAHLDAWREEGLFVQDRPAIYVYEQEFVSDGRTCVRRGFFCRALLGEWGQAGIYPHEKTLAGPKVDRLNLMRAMRGQPGPVFGLLTDDDGQVRDALAGLANYAPVAKISTEGGVTERFWVADQEEPVAAFLKQANLGEVFIADGHHRYETALTYRNEVREKMRQAGRTPPPLGELDCDYVLILIVPDSDHGLVIWPTHRLVYGVAGFSAEKLMAGCAEHFSVTPVKDAAQLNAKLEQAKLPAYGLVLPGGLHYLELKDLAVMDRRAANMPAPWRELDVSVLHLLILEDLLGIDEGKLLRKENILYSKNAGEAVRQAQAGAEGVQVGFILRPTLMKQVCAVARAGAVMPQKSTYFYPKALSGLVMHLFW